MTNKKEFLTFDKFQLVNQRGKKQVCELCSKKFTVFFRQHCCKRCLRSVCQQCKAMKTMVYDQKLNRKIQGICASCKIQVEFIKNYIQHYKLQFGQQSDIGAKWLKRVKNDELNFKIIDNKRQILFSEEMYNQLWESYNYSLRQFIGILTFQRKSGQVYKMISDVIKQVSSKMQVRLQNIIYLVVFVLCHCSVQTTKKIVIQLLYYQKLSNFNKQNLLNYLRVLNCQNIEIKKLQQFIDYKIKKFINNFSFNIFTFQISLYCFGEIIQKKNTSELQRFFPAIIYQQRQYLIQNLKNKTDCQIYLLRNLDFKKVQQTYKILKTQDKKKGYSNISRSISTTQKLIQRASTFQQSSLKATQQNDEKLRRLSTSLSIQQSNKNIQESSKKSRQQQNQKIRKNQQKRDFKKKSATFDIQGSIQEVKASVIVLGQRNQQQLRKSRQGSSSSRKNILDEKISNSFQTPIINTNVLFGASSPNPNSLLTSNNLNKFNTQLYINPIKINTNLQQTYSPIKIQESKSNISKEKDQKKSVNSDISNKKDLNNLVQISPALRNSYQQQKIKSEFFKKSSYSSTSDRVQQGIDILNQSMKISNEKQQYYGKNNNGTTSSNSETSQQRHNSDLRFLESSLQLDNYKLKIKQSEEKIQKLQKQKTTFNKQRQVYKGKIAQLIQNEKINEITIVKYKNQIQMLKIRIQNLQIQKKAKITVIQRQQISQLKKQNEILMNSIKQKNNRIDTLMRQIKVLNYEIQKQKQCIKKYESDNEKDLKNNNKIEIKVLQEQNKNLKQSNKNLIKKIQQLTLNIIVQEQKQINQSRVQFQKTQQSQKQCIIF